MAAKKVAWTFPREGVHFLKIEVFTLFLISILVFFFSFLNVSSWPLALLYTLIFMAIYLLISYFGQLFTQVEEKYHLTSTHLHMTKKNRFRTKKHKIPLKKISFLKLDRFFLGGYALSDKGRHTLTFNTRKELDNFTKRMKKYT